ncbi:MAG TPA: outer membrane beta-barrel family protein, partial [Segetibacter sp.]
MDIDKKVFGVDKNIVSAGGTALDVMKNVPSVNVDIDGNVALRNSPPQIFVDGRPTTLTLDQIPADAIENVEVITNPSAKYDASGGGAGILNIVLKKNKKTGYNGNLRAGVDKRGAVNGGLDINVRQGKINFFASANVNQMKGVTTGVTNRLNFVDTPQTLINQNNYNKTRGAFVFGRAGFDYFVTNRTTLSFAGFKVHGEFKPNEFININTDSLYNASTIKSYSERNSTGNRVFNGQGGAFGLKYIFPKEGKELTADASYFSGKNENSSFYTTNTFSNGAGSSVKESGLQKIAGDGSDYNIILQTDFVNPVTSKTKLETGVRAAIRSRTNNNDNFYFDKGLNNYIVIPSATSSYKSDDNVYAAYVSITSSIKNFGYKLGLRAESSDYTGQLTKSGEKFSNKYPVSLFPSIFLSQKLNNKQELQMSYTRRINRPNFFQLIPFVDYTDPLNISKGNPGLVPEFTNSMELSYSKTFQKNNTFLASLYYKKTTDLITRFMNKEINPFTSKEAIINTFINANSSQSYGSELTTQIYPTKWWDFTTNLNLYNSAIEAFDSATSQNSLWSWFGKFNSNFKLPADFTVQLSATYQSKTNLTPGGGGGFGGPPGARGGGASGGPGGFGQAQSASQGYIRPFYGVDIAVKKSFLK